MKFKTKKIENTFTKLHPVLIMIVADLAQVLESEFKYELTITDALSTKKQDEELGRVSSSHRESRAVDIRISDMPPNVLRRAIDYINMKDEYKKFHYQRTNGKFTLALAKKDHIHLAIHSRFKRV